MPALRAQGRVYGLTLVELLIASFIFSMVAVTVYASFHAGIAGLRRTEKAIASERRLRIVFERLNADLRNAFAFSDQESGFTGYPAGLKFFTLADFYRDEAMGREYSCVAYYLQAGCLMRACCRGKASLDCGSGSPAEEMADQIQAIRFSYGYRSTTAATLSFRDTWVSQGTEGGVKFLPVAVRVAIVAADTPSITYERTIYLPLAAYD